ncbi:MAG: hypothetical protein WCF90_09985 [Methanomicrobiales archaeon]
MRVLHPDEVITYAGSKPKSIDQLTAANITFIYLDSYLLPTHVSDARALGISTGSSNEAKVYARNGENVVAEGLAG